MLRRRKMPDRPPGEAGGRYSQSLLLQAATIPSERSVCRPEAVNASKAAKKTIRTIKDAMRESFMKGNLAIAVRY
jgi:hypothetical protein